MTTTSQAKLDQAITEVKARLDNLTGADIKGILNAPHHVGLVGHKPGADAVRKARIAALKIADQWVTAGSASSYIGKAVLPNCRDAAVRSYLIANPTPEGWSVASPKVLAGATSGTWEALRTHAIDAVLATVLVEDLPAEQREVLLSGWASA